MRWQQEYIELMRGISQGHLFEVISHLVAVKFPFFCSAIRNENARDSVSGRLKYMCKCNCGILGDCQTTKQCYGLKLHYHPQSTSTESAHDGCILIYLMATNRSTLTWKCLHLPHLPHSKQLFHECTKKQADNSKNSHLPICNRDWKCY